VDRPAGSPHSRAVTDRHSFLVVAMPWYLLCYWRNGWPFIEDFILKQHFARITSASPDACAALVVLLEMAAG